MIGCCGSGVDGSVAADDVCVTVDAMGSGRVGMDIRRPHAPWDLGVMGPDKPCTPPRLFEVLLDKSDPTQRIGLCVRSDGGGNLLVDEVGPGLVAEWNASQTPAQRVMKGDALIEVNGERGTPIILLVAMARAKHARLLVQAGLAAR
mmetsp:Transcript_113772/g.317775  ORF Transcript_113772/g.317775 Transcript_113772/m.317775 type:complete len:147 (-) Transcript_113772:188-628(-)